MKRFLACAIAASVIVGHADAQEMYASIGATTNDGFDDGAVTARYGAAFTEYFGAEAEGSYFFDGEFGFFGAYGVGRIPAGDRVTVLARVGYGLYTDFDDSEDAIAYGVGAEYAVTPSGAVRADYTRVDAGEGFDEEGFFTLSYVFKFGGAQ